EGIVALSRREVCAPSVKIRKAGRPPGKKGTTGSDFLVFVEQLLNTLDVRDLKYKYLVMENASIHKTMHVQE
ncbi:hypothetical protein DFQ30_005621, partial [Apophysomyces sp. BC1015]